MARRRSSIDIRRVRRFFRLRTIPKIPIRKRRKKKSINSVGRGTLSEGGSLASKRGDVAKRLLQKLVKLEAVGSSPIIFKGRIERKGNKEPKERRISGRLKKKRLRGRTATKGKRKENDRSNKIDRGRDGDDRSGRIRGRDRDSVWIINNRICKKPIIKTTIIWVCYNGIRIIRSGGIICTDGCIFNIIYILGKEWRRKGGRKGKAFVSQR